MTAAGSSTTTAQRLSAAAAALADVLSAGHDGLPSSDLAIAGQARDQVLACLTIAQRYLFAGLGHTTHLSSADYLRHPMLGLEEALRRRRPTGLTGPAPTDLAMAPPDHPTARAWTVLARELDAASVEIARARPDNPSWAWRWAGLAPRSSTGLPPPGSPDVAWGLAADLAALCVGLAAADEQLAHAFAAAQTAAAADPRPSSLERQEIEHSFATAHDAVTGRSLTDLRVVAGLALRMAEDGPLPDDYHLPLHTVGLAPLVPAAAADLAPALGRAQDMLADGPPLTHLEHRTVAVELTRAAALLARLVDDPTARQALLRLAQGTDNAAKVWASSALFAATEGSRAPGDQLHAVNAFFISDVTVSDITRPAGGARPETVRDAVERSVAQLPGIARAAADNAARGLNEGSFVAVDRFGDRYQPAERPLSTHPEGRRYENAVSQLRAVSADVRQVLPYADPAAHSTTTSRPARALLRAVVNTPSSRPDHPALPPPLLSRPGPTPPRPHAVRR